MKHFLKFIAIFALLLSKPQLHAEKTSLTLTQTALYPAGCDLKLSANSTLFSGFFLTKSREQLPSYKPEVYSWGIKINPLPPLSLLTGSITVTGLPARAKNPVFNLASPFYSPVSIQNNRILSTGATKQTGNTAFELSAHNYRIAAFSGVLDSLDDPSWVYLSKVFPAFSLNDTSTFLSFYGGTRQKSITESGDSWFVREAYTPPSRIFFPGTELLVAKGRLSAGMTVFLDIERFRKPSSAFRAEASCTGKTFSLSAGGYFSDSEFTNIEGTREKILSRFFFAPSLQFPPVSPFKIEARFGGIVFSDTVRREKYYEADTRTVSGGTGLILYGNSFQARTQVMKKENDCSVSASVHVRDVPARGVRITLSGQRGREGTSLASELTVKPLTWISAGIGVKRTTQENDMKPCVAGDLSLAFNFATRHLSWDLSTVISASNTLAPEAGSIVLKTALQ